MKKGIYKHYKGNAYEVIDLARHSETEELMVVYKALYESKFGKDTLWVRPLEMFEEKVLVDGNSILRFELVEEI